MRQTIRRTANDLVDEWYERGEVDYLAELQALCPLPCRSPPSECFALMPGG